MCHTDQHVSPLQLLPCGAEEEAHLKQPSEGQGELSGWLDESGRESELQRRWSEAVQGPAAHQKRERVYEARLGPQTECQELRGEATG